MRNSYGYDSYRGRSGVRTVLTVLIIVLLVLLLLAVGFFFFAQRYVVYYDDGSVHFEFPWTVQNQPTPSPTPDQPPVVVTPSPTPEPTPEPTPLPLLVELEVSSLTGGTAAAEVAAAGGNAALFTMKGEDGRLGYTSAQKWANYAKVTQTDPALNESITAALAGDDLYAVARICCFKDDAAPYYYGRSNGLRDGSGNWRDETGSRWFSPAAQGARDYIMDLCREVAGLGFDELWLDYAFFPSAGRLNRIVRGEAYNEETLENDLEEFYRQLRESLADYPDLKISLTVSPDLMSGRVDLVSGQTWELLGTYADHVYLGPGEISPEDPFFPGGDASSLFSPQDVIWFGREILPDTMGRVLP